MFSLQEIAEKMKPQLDNIKTVMDYYGAYHPEMLTPDHKPADIFYGLSKADAYELRETLNNLSLAELLAKTGPFGNAYLVAAGLHDTLLMASQQTDIVPQISMVATAWPDANLNVPICDDLLYYPVEFASGGQLPQSVINTATRPTIVPISFGLAPVIATDMLEDSQYALIEFLTRQAARGIGKKATTLALTVLKTATDGVGTMNPVTAGASETTPAQVLEGVDAVGQDEFLANTMIVTPEAWEHSIAGIEVAGGAGGDYWRPLDAVTFPPITQGYDAKFHMLDVKFSTNAQLHASTDVQGAAFLECVTIIFDRNSAMLTGRKRWMQIDNYADPIKGLAGCVVTCRQDSVTIYDDSIAVATET